MPSLASPVHDDRHATGLLSLARKLWLWALQWRHRRTAEAELASMNDYMLDDIGVSRCEVARLVRRGRDK